MRLLALFIWLVLLVSTCQALFLIWFLCHVLHLRQLIWRKVHCPWCWRVFHLDQRFPAQWTSCLCQHHYQIERRRLAARRAARRAAPTTTAALPVGKREPVPERVEVLV